MAADHESGGQQRFLDLADVHRAVPDIRDVAREERPRLTPIGAIIVLNLAECSAADLSGSAVGLHFSRTGSADRSPTARPCRPATAFDFRQPRARARGRARQGKCWRETPLHPDAGGGEVIHINGPQCRLTHAVGSAEWAEQQRKDGDD